MVPKFLKVSKWYSFLLKHLTFALAVKSTLMLEGMPRVSSSIFYFLFLNFFLNFYFILFFDFFKKNQKIATCQAVIVPRGSAVTRVSIPPRVILLVSIWSLYFNLSQFSPNFCKNEQFCPSPN